MLWNRSVTLIGKVQTGKDSDGFPIYDDTRLENVPAYYQSVYGNEFYTANQQGIKADLVIVIASVNYSGETVIEDEETNHRYELVRHFEKGPNMELTVTDLGVVQSG